MAIIVKPNTFSAGAVIIASEHNANFDTIYTDYNGNITNANISASAAIVDTKLAQITTASKVSGTAITGLASLPAGAGVIPSANLPASSATSPVVGSYSNLAVSRGSVTQVTVTADNLIVYDASNGSARATSVNVTAAITSSGANGLDTGAEASDTWYYIWIIRKSSDGTVASLLSVSSTIGTITFPSGYDQAALVSAVRNDGSSNFINFNQYGNDYWYAAWTAIASGNVGASQSITISSLVPSVLSQVARGSLGVSNGYTAISNLLANVGDATTIAGNKFIAADANSNLISWELNVLTANTLYWCSAYASGAVYISGFRITKVG